MSNSNMIGGFTVLLLIFALAVMLFRPVEEECDSFDMARIHYMEKCKADAKCTYDAAQFELYIKAKRRCEAAQ